MPSAAVFVSNLSLASTTNSLKTGVSDNKEEPPGKKKSKGGTAILFYTSAAAVVSSAVPTGYNVGVLNAPQQIIQRFANESIYSRYGFVLSEAEVGMLWSNVVSVFLIGGMFGSLLAGWLCNKFGRRGAILRVNIIGLVSSIFFASCQSALSFEMLILARFLMGFCGGFSTSAVPVYLTEISPENIRGPLGVLQPLGMNLGLLVSLILGLDSIMGTDTRWPYLLSLFAFPVAAGSGVLLFCPESPKYLFIVKGNPDEALRELSRLRNLPIKDLDEDVLEMKKELKQSIKCPSWSLFRVITSMKVRRPLLLLCIMHAGQQLSGINAVFYYSAGIFSKAGMNNEESQYAGIGAGLANFIMSAISTLLIAKFGRKFLFLTSCVLVITFLVGLTTSFTFMDFSPLIPYSAVAFLLMFVLSFGLGLGPIPFYIGSELFLPGPRPVAMSIGCTVNWVSNFLVGVSFPMIQGVFGHFAFVLFIGFTFAVWIAIYQFLPETKDKSIEEIQDYFCPKHKRKSLSVDIEDSLMLEPIDPV